MADAWIPHSKSSDRRLVGSPAGEKARLVLILVQVAEALIERRSMTASEVRRLLFAELANLGKKRQR